jgi:hypothetical protein
LQDIGFTLRQQGEEFLPRSAFGTMRFQ